MSGSLHDLKKGKIHTVPKTYGCVRRFMGKDDANKVTIENR